MYANVNEAEKFSNLLEGKISFAVTERKNRRFKDTKLLKGERSYCFFPKFKQASYFEIDFEIICKVEQVVCSVCCLMFFLSR